MTGTTEGGRKASEGGRGDPHKASPAAIEKGVKGISYPASKDDLISQAKTNGAPSDVMEVLSRFEEKDYKSPIDIAKETSKAE
jgi:hypothetical protein